MLAGNSIGKEFTVTSFGESHGKIVGAVVDGCPAGLRLSEADVQAELDRRIPLKPEIVSGRIEKDKVQILSGVFNGFTTGAPISMMVENKEADSSDYEAIRDLPRPGHADYTARVRYGGFNDYRGGGRFSGRVTVALIMAGAVAKKLLGTVDVDILAYTRAIDRIKMDKSLSFEEIRRRRYEAAVRCPDLACAKKMEEAIVNARKEGDSLGGVIECIALNVPAGVGEPLFDSLDADLAKMLLSVPAVKGVEFGAGFRATELKGSENNDAFRVQGGKVAASTNNAGGILGGLSSGMPIVVRVAVKPTPSIAKEQRTVNIAEMKDATIRVTGRHDPCVVPKAVPVVESAVAIVLADHMIRAGFIPKVLKERK
ncbi:chorismate synthase [Candidatus Bathyarchaeota archaeon A05DMB-2]|nr:chorismate synthase [Candidatus Bathyarchaeota archaeon A05DMB-2]